MAHRRDILGPLITGYDIATIQRASNYVGRLFDEIVRAYGENTARKIFAPYGRPLSRREQGDRRNAADLWELLTAEKQNIAALARKKAGKDGKPRSEGKKLRRFKKHPKIRAIVEKMAHDPSSYGDDNPYTQIVKFLKIMNELHPGPDED
jgi:hypothetical protein